MPLTYKQTVNNGGNSTTLVWTPLVAGSVALLMFDQSRTISSDSSGDIWTQDGNIAGFTESYHQVTSTTAARTITFSGLCRAVLVEISGQGAAPVDKWVGLDNATNGSTNANSGSLTPTSNNDMLVEIAANFCNVSSTYTSTSGQTTEVNALLLNGEPFWTAIRQLSGGAGVAQQETGTSSVGTVNGIFVSLWAIRPPSVGGKNSLMLMGAGI